MSMLDKKYKPDLVRVWIKRKKMKIGDVATRLGLTASELSQVFSGYKTTPDNFYVRIEGIIGVPREKFME